MLTLVAVGFWHEQTPSITTPAYAKIPDSGQQLQQVIDTVEKMQVSLDEVGELLLSGKIKVQVVEPKNKKDKPQDVK